MELRISWQIFCQSALYHSTLHRILRKKVCWLIKSCLKIFHFLAFFNKMSIQQFQMFSSFQSVQQRQKVHRRKSINELVAKLLPSTSSYFSFFPCTHLIFIYGTCFWFYGNIPPPENLTRPESYIGEHFFSSFFNTLLPIIMLEYLHEHVRM